MTVLVIDAGTSGIRAAVIRAGGEIVAEQRREVLPDSPASGLVEFDADNYAAAAIELAVAALAEATTAGVPAVDAVGISNQRASCIVWDRATGRAVAPAQGWQDLRTLGDCLVLAAEGLRFAPNQTATKARNIWDAVDPERRRDLCVGTPDAWLVWKLTEGSVHATDASNAGVTGLATLTASGAGDSDRDRDRWNARLLDALRIPASAMPTIVDSIGFVGYASALPGSPPIMSMVGDQQASLAGQGAVHPGMAKITFGTGAMLDVCLGDAAPESAQRSDGGTFPIACWRQNGAITWGLESIMLSAGTNVQWLRDDLGIIETAADSARIAALCEHTDGVVYVPAQMGLGTPHWDYGARSGLFGVTRGTERSHVVRAVLEGVAHRGVDLVEAAEADASALIRGLTISVLRIDGGMSENPVFTQALADLTGRRVEVAPEKEATAAGAAALAELALGTFDGWDDLAGVWHPARVIEPEMSSEERSTARDRWARAVERCAGWHGDLSALDF